MTPPTTHPAAVVPPVRRFGAWLAGHLLLSVLFCTLLALACTALVSGWSRLWFSPDQRGAWLLMHGKPAAAAEAYEDPAWRGIALMWAGAFKDALAQFTSLDTAEAAYNAGNALVMLGRYDEAVASYSRALELRPGWADAQSNRTLASVRAARLRTPTDGNGVDEVPPDKIVYDKNARNNKAAKDDPASAMSDEGIRSLWLKRVDTKPSDFLRAEFAYQLRNGATAGQATEPRP